MYDEDATVFTAMQAGARATCSRAPSRRTSPTRIRAVVARPGDLRAGHRRPAAGALRQSAGRGGPDDLFPELTAREKEMLELLARGRRTAEIASTLHLSPKTVSNNLTTIFAKLEVADRTSAVIRARERGLGARTGVDLFGPARHGRRGVSAAAGPHSWWRRVRSSPPS